MSQIETNLDDFLAANEQGLDERFPFALQSAQFSPIVAKPIARRASCFFVPGRSRFSRAMGILLRDVVCRFSPLYAGAETNDSQFARSMNSDAKKEGMQH
jgi:hypothetical protein